MWNQDEIAKARAIIANQERQKQLEDYNAQKSQLDNKYNGGLGGFLGGIIGGIGKGVSDVGNTLIDMFGSSIASARDLGSIITTGKSAGEEEKWLKSRRGTDDIKDARLKTGGQALNAATTLASTAVPGLGSGAAAKALGGTIANTAAGAIGGVADEFQQQGKDAQLDSIANRAISGAAAGLATGGLNKKIGNATGKYSSALLNNKLATSAIGRGALSGAVGGATGAGTSAALGGGDIAQAALQGGLSGAASGGVQAGLTNAASSAFKKARNRTWVGDIVGEEPPKRATTQELQNIINEEYDLGNNTTPLVEQANDNSTNQGGITTQPDSDITANNKTVEQTPKELSTSLSGKLRKKSAESLLDQYGTLTKPMAKSANAVENVQIVADAGFTKPADVERMIEAVTGNTGKVTKLTRKLVDTAKPVNTFDGVDDLINNEIAMSGLTETDAKSVKSMIDAQLNSLPSRREGSISYEDNPTDVFNIVKKLEKRSANLKGKSGTNYSTTTPERTDKARVLDTIATELKNRIYNNAAPMESVLTADVAQDLKSLAPKNKKWADYVDNKIMASKNIGELRNTMAPFVNMGKVIEDQYMNYGTYGQRVGDAAQIVGKGVQALFKVPVAGQIAEAIATSNAAKRATAKAYQTAADVTSKNATEATIVPSRPSTTASQLDSTPTSIEPQVAPMVQPSTTNNLLYNFIGRTQGEIASGDMIQNARKAQDYQNLEDMFAGIQTGSDGSTMAQTNGLLGTSQMQQQSPLLAQMQDISNAMSNALAAGDVQAYGQLADLYKDAYNTYQMQEKMYGTTNPQSNMSTAEKNQLAKLQSAGTALDQLESLYTKAGGGQGIIGGNIANFLGGIGLNSDVNTYNQLAQGLINQIGAAIGKTDSLNTKGEVQRALSLVPKITDDNQTAMNKIATLRSLLQTNTGTYNQLYGA